MRGKETSLEDRLNTAKMATQARLARARANDPSQAADFAEQQEARRVAAAARDARIAERTAARRAAEARAAEALAAAKAAQKAAATADAAVLEAERKAARDARYAARKARVR